MRQIGASLAFALAVVVRVWGAEYLTAGVDAQRTGWVKDEKIFTPQNVSGMKLLWKTKLESTPREMHNLFPPLVVERVTTARGLSCKGICDD